MAGFNQVVPNTIEIPIEGGPTIPVAPLPLSVLLKLVAFTDRKAAKDLGSVLHCLEHYLEDDDRRYDVDHEGAGIGGASAEGGQLRNELLAFLTSGEKSARVRDLIGRVRSRGTW